MRLLNVLLTYDVSVYIYALALAFVLDSWRRTFWAHVVCFDFEMMQCGTCVTSETITASMIVAIQLIVQMYF